MRRANAVVAAVALCFGPVAFPAPIRAQDDGPDLRLGGLLRTGLRLEAAHAGGTDGFEIYDARLGLSGRVGIVFDYRAQVEYDFSSDRVRLLDAALSLPFLEEIVGLDVGIVKSPFGREAMRDKGDIQFVERSQGALVLATGRQLGVQVHGALSESRFRYWGGLFNGNGPRFENDNGSFLFAARAEYSTVGDVEFFEDLVFRLGASVAFSKDSALAVLPVSEPAPADPSAGPDPEVRSAVGLAEHTGDRLVWGADLEFGYRSYSIVAEYTRADYDPVEGDGLASEGWFVEAGYRLWGALDWLLRYDSLLPAGGVGMDAERSQFLVLGLNMYPGFHAKIGFQYAFGLAGTALGPAAAIDGTNTGPALADNQFLLNLQVSF